MKTIDVLRSLNFSKLDAAKLAEAGALVRVPAGWSPMQKGTVGEKVYLVLTGSLKVKDADHPVKPGEALGERSVQLNALRNATIVADEDSYVLHFTPETWLRLLHTVPALALRVQETQARRETLDTCP